MPVAWDLHYDRRVPEAFLSHFLPGGVAHSLVEYARFAPYAMDLQMRHNPKTGAHHATLYVGLTAVLGVKQHASGLELTPHKWAADGSYGFSTSWTHPSSAEDLAKHWRAVEDYIERIAPEAWGKHASQEGAVQAAASVFESHDRLMFDREAALHFRDTATKQQIFKEETSDLVEAVSAIPGIPGKPPTSFGGECDLLALDPQGRLLAIEVKPRGTGSIVWSGVQATVYARLFSRWIDAPAQETDAPTTVLRGMLEQRAQLGLIPADRPQIPEVPAVVPIVAIERGWNPKYVARLKEVQKAIAALELPDPPLEIYEVSMAGRLDRLA